MALALGADALMFAGRYREARDRFAGYNRAHGDNPDGEEWRLKEAFLNVLVDQFETAEQVRDPDKAESLLLAATLELTFDELVTTANQVLRCDALNASA